MARKKLFRSRGKKLGLPPGTYELSLHPESLPSHAVLAGSATQIISLTAGAKSPPVFFRVNTERPVLILSPISQPGR